VQRTPPEYARVSRLVNARGGATGVDFASWRWRGAFAGGVSKVQFNRSADRAALIVDQSPGTATLVVLKKLHPDTWVGAAWYPEFWMAAIFFCAGFWSFVRDRRILK
jgi:hypothetical protein